MKAKEKEAEIMKKKQRDPNLDDYYLWQAHQQLETFDETKFAKKLKSFRIPFRNEIRQDEGKLE